MAKLQPLDTPNQHNNQVQSNNYHNKSLFTTTHTYLQHEHEYLQHEYTQSPSDFSRPAYGINVLVLICCAAWFFSSLFFFFKFFF
jgi:hypothetical protein